MSVAETKAVPATATLLGVEMAPTQGLVDVMHTTRKLMRERGGQEGDWLEFERIPGAGMFVRLYREES